ncbi:MAG: hypothetical protein ACP5NV_02720 [Candidatus Woesearchaeota archaeon]
MGMFKSSKSDLSAGADTPIEQVTAMKNQGYTNNQIIQTLQRDGYTSSQIFDAMSQSEMSGSTIGFSNQSMPAQNPIMPTSMNPIGQNQMSQGMGMNQGSALGMNTGMGPVGSGMGGMPSMGGASNEELIEAIIDEKWNELVKDINKVIEWKQKADVKLQVMEQKVNDMKEQFDKLHQAIIGKIGEYDKNMLNVATELQAMEKVFSKVLPTFMDNVNELSRITGNIKTNDQSSINQKKKNVTPQKNNFLDD